MKLKEYIRNANEEVEVWDQYIDIRVPYYGNCYRHEIEYSFKDNNEEHYLFLLEYWLLCFEVTQINETSVCIDVFHELKRNWDDVLDFMKQYASYQDFLNRYDDHYDDNMIADCVEDIFIALSQGYESIAQDFCLMLGIMNMAYTAISDKVLSHKIQVVDINTYPDHEQIYFVELEDLASDISQGSGNVIIRYFYIPALNIVCKYADY